MPPLGSSKPAIIRSVVVLPEPEGPSIVKNSPRCDLEVDARDRDHLAVVLGEAGQADVGWWSGYTAKLSEQVQESKDKFAPAGWPGRSTSRR